MEIKKKIKNKVYTCLFGEGTLTWMKYMRLCYSMFNNGKILCTPNPPPGCPLYCVQLGLLCIKASVQYINFWDRNMRYNIISWARDCNPMKIWHNILDTQFLYLQMPNSENLRRNWQHWQAGYICLVYKFPRGCCGSGSHQ